MNRAILSTLCLGLVAAACANRPDDQADQAEQMIGPAGIEFVTVPVPGADCDSIVLKGTRRFQGRAYVLPQAYVGVDAAGKPLFEVLGNADGSYSVRLGIFFPGGRGDESRADNNRRIRKDCSYDRIREVVNAGIPAEERIGDPSPLLVNYIRAKLPGTENAAMIGHEGTDILSYVGQDSIVEFKLTGEPALRDFVTRLRSNIGVQLDLDFIFAAQTADTFEATVDFRANADKLDAAFAAGVPLDGLMVDAEFRARIARAMQTMSLELYTESSNDAFRQFADRIVERMVLDNPALQIRPPAVPDGLPNGAQAPNGQAADTLIRVNVTAALEALKAQGTYTIKLMNIGEAAARTYSAHTILRASFTEPGVSELALYSDDEGAVFTEDVRPGTNLYLVPSGRATEDIEYHYRTTTFRTREDLFAAEHNMAARFELLGRHPGSVNYPQDRDAYMYDGWAINVFNWSYYTWGFETLTSDFHNRRFSRLAPGEVADLTNVGVTFSRVGRPYTFRELTEEHSLWEATLEPQQNRVLLRAKSDLGRLKLENTETFRTVTHPASAPGTQLYERRYFQDYWSSFGSFSARTTSVVGEPRALPAQRSAVYVKVIPERGELSAINQRGIVVAPRDPGGILHPPPNQEPRQP